MLQDHIKRTRRINKQFLTMNPLDIYVAGSWKDRENIHSTWIKNLKRKGHKITHDWTQSEKERETKRDLEYHKNCARKDIEGVINCDLMVVIMDSSNSDYSYRGTWTEIGARIGANKILEECGKPTVPIILYNPFTNSDDLDEMAELTRNVTNVFYWHESLTRVTTGNEVFNLVKEFSNKV